VAVEYRSPGTKEFSIRSESYFVPAAKIFNPLTDQVRGFVK
jgi:hypothetical protein